MNKLEAAVIEVKELTHYNQHAEAVIVMAQYACDKHYGMKGVETLVDQANGLKLEQERIGYLTQDLRLKRENLIHLICNLFYNYETKAFKEAM